MATDMTFDDGVVVEAKKSSHHRTKKGSGHDRSQGDSALKKQLEILSMFGNVDFDERYDNKKARNV